MKNPQKDPNRFSKNESILIQLGLLLLMVGYYQWQDGKMSFAFLKSKPSVMLAGLSEGIVTSLHQRQFARAAMFSEPLQTSPSAFSKSELKAGSTAESNKLSSNVKSKPKRLASISTDSFIFDFFPKNRPPRPENSIEVGMDGSSKYLLPTVRYQIALARALTLGLHYSYVAGLVSGPQGQMMGGGVSLAYYPGGYAYQGLFIETDASLFQIKARSETRTSHVAPGVFSTSIGWTGELNKVFHFTAAGGVGMIDTFGRDSGDISLARVVPVFRLGVGYDF